ncbi:2690_t:CDS:10 [Ambispora leptoticha]|uniref:2690_t:CDS:1 n=1 Tax=Ambispora leptoticha TaxID=144679 RepID=A0A9N8YSI3_9GLOM|nr:2690_t:CDS:10 [Ambispora leptoticha]
MSSSKRSLSETTVQEETTSLSTASAGNKIANAVNETFMSLTCNFADLPSWLQDNHDILRGYRRPTFSYIKCAKSLFYLHNESGAVGFIVLAFTTYIYTLSSTSSVKWWDFLVFYCFLAGAMICLSLSSLFHTFCCHSEKVCADWNRCDYIGIVTLIVGSFYPMIYYGFYCNSVLQIVYLSLISVFGIATIIVAVAPTFRSPEFRWFRTGLFLSMGLSAVFPIGHAIALYGIHLCFDVISLKHMLIMGLFYVVGAIIYGCRVPERWYPGKFDIWGASHQIFHVCVVSAAVVHYHGVILAMSYWHKENHECKVDIRLMQPS